MGNSPLIEDHGGRVAYVGLADDPRDALVASTNGRILSRDVELKFDDRNRLDLLLTLEMGGQTAKIAVETLRHAYPRDVQAAIWRLGEYQLSAQDAYSTPKRTRFPEQSERSFQGKANADSTANRTHIPRVSER